MLLLKMKDKLELSLSREEWLSIFHWGVVALASMPLSVLLSLSFYQSPKKAIDLFSLWLWLLLGVCHPQTFSLYLLGSPLYVFANAHDMGMLCEALYKTRISLSFRFITYWIKVLHDPSRNLFLTSVSDWKFMSHGFQNVCKRSGFECVAFKPIHVRAWN